MFDQSAIILKDIVFSHELNDYSGLNLGTSIGQIQSVATILVPDRCLLIAWPMSDSRSTLHSSLTVEYASLW